MKIEALHDFFDQDYAQLWAERFEPSPDRLALFDLMLSYITSIQQESIRVLELGIGPGYLAHHILSGSNHVQYEGLDFSAPMLSIAKKNLVDYAQRLSLVQADLTDTSWTKQISQKPNVIVSTWALHDLYSSERIASVYRRAYSCLALNGILLNGDFIKPEESTYEYEGGRIKPSAHLNHLRMAKFEDVQCLKIFENNVDEPTTSNNYACFYGLKK